ncbi:hypothetical protein BG60_23465 [Caballeronia zhejiangensis]|uniref:Uncharacterized protein n=1 Tax=Caballeronia zhejiangensis TaxID=871203 RepID=A0A656QG17_9BURK|nr:hypothetical protein BG60_23465 [Caballeronia zhejiangensis]
MLCHQSMNVGNDFRRLFLDDSLSLRLQFGNLRLKALKGGHDFPVHGCKQCTMPYAQYELRALAPRAML